MEQFNVNGWYKIYKQDGYDDYMDSRGLHGNVIKTYEVMVDMKDPQVFHHISDYNGVRNEFHLPLGEEFKTGFIWKEGEPPKFLNTRCCRPKRNEFTWQLINTGEFWTFDWQSDDKMTITGLDCKTLVTCVLYFERVPGPTRPYESK